MNAVRRPPPRGSRPQSSLADRAAATRASASHAIGNGRATRHPDAALLAAAERARPLIAQIPALVAEFQRLNKLSSVIAEEKLGPYPYWRTSPKDAKAYDEKESIIQAETGRHAAWKAMSDNDTAIWRILSRYKNRPARTLEGAAAKTILAALDLWDPEEAVLEIATLFYGDFLIHEAFDAKQLREA